MKAGAKALILAAVLLGGCRATRDVAVTSYHVTHGVAVGSYRVTRAVAVGSYRAATAPVHLIRGHSDEPPHFFRQRWVLGDGERQHQSEPAPQAARQNRTAARALRRQPIR